MVSLVYYLGIALLFTHEMDAVMFAEWRLLYVLREFDDALAYPVFLLLHIPLFMAFLWLGNHPVARVQDAFRGITAGFLVVHAIIHTVASVSPANAFAGVLSYGLIYLAALCGLLYFALRYRRDA